MKEIKLFDLEDKDLPKIDKPLQFTIKQYKLEDIIFKENINELNKKIKQEINKEFNV